MIDPETYQVHSCGLQRTAWASESELIALAAWMTGLLRRHHDPGSENRNSGTEKGKSTKEKKQVLLAVSEEEAGEQP